MNNPRAILYLRSASTPPSGPDPGIQRPRIICRRWAQQHDIEIVGEGVDHAAGRDHAELGAEAVVAGVAGAEGPARARDQIHPRLEGRGHTKVVDGRADDDGVGSLELGDQGVGDVRELALRFAALLGRGRRSRRSAPRPCRAENSDGGLW